MCLTACVNEHFPRRMNGPGSRCARNCCCGRGAFRQSIGRWRLRKKATDTSQARAFQVRAETLVGFCTQECVVGPLGLQTPILSIAESSLWPFLLLCGGGCETRWHGDLCNGFVRLSPVIHLFLVTRWWHTSSVDRLRAGVGATLRSSHGVAHFLGCASVHCLRSLSPSLGALERTRRWPCGLCVRQRCGMALSRERVRSKDVVSDRTCPTLKGGVGLGRGFCDHCISRFRCRACAPQRASGSGVGA